jgi:hypothetical protein
VVRRCPNSGERCPDRAVTVNRLKKGPGKANPLETLQMLSKLARSKKANLDKTASGYIPVTSGTCPNLSIGALQHRRP